MASAVIGALRVNLSLDTAQFEDGLRKAQKSLSGIGQSMTRIGGRLSAAVTAPLVGFGALTLKTAGDFEASMSRVSAATGATGDQFKALEELARELGKTTIFSAQESADAMEVLAKNGLTIEQILGGATQASLDLAAATGSDMAGAADVATDVMLSFNKTTADMGNVVDGITGTLLESKFGFDDYRLAIGQAGGVAGGLGVEFEDFNAALVATANLFTSGSDAGTSFKTFLTRLVPQTKGAAAAMKELGLEFFDVQGNMKSIPDIATELRDAFSGMSEEARTQNMKELFGVDAMRTAIGLAGTTAERFREIQTALSEASGAEQAAARLGPFNAAMEQLGGAFEELQLSIAKSGLIEFFTNMVGKLTELTNYLAETNPAILKWGTVIAGLAATLGPAVFAIGLLVTGIAAIGAPVALAVAGIAALTAGIVAFWPEISNLATQISTFVSGAWAQFEAAWDGMVAKVHAVKDSIVQFASEIPGIFTNLAAQMVTIGGQIIDGLWQGLKAKWDEVKGWVTGIANYIPDIFRKETDTHSPSRVMHAIGVDVMAGLGNGMQSMQSGVTNIAENIASTISSAFSGIIDGTKTVKEAIADVLKSLSKLLLDQAFKALLGGIGGGGGGFLSGLFGNLFGFARGGSIMPGGAGGIDSQLVAFRKSPNERVDISKPGQSIGGGDVHVTVGLASDGALNIMPEVRSVAQGEAASAARVQGAATMKQVKSSMPGMIAETQLRTL